MIANQFKRLEVLEDMPERAEGELPGEPVDEEKFILPLLTDFDNEYYPPKMHFSANASRQLRTLEKRLKDFSFKYEVIEEKVSKAAPLRCDCVLHVKNPSLLKNHRYLAN